MRTRLVAIGNSRGIRLPKAVIEQYQLANDVELEMRADHLVLRPARTPRAGWDEAFSRLTRKGADDVLDNSAVHAETDWEQTEWRW